MKKTSVRGEQMIKYWDSLYLPEKTKKILLSCFVKEISCREASRRANVAASTASKTFGKFRNVCVASMNTTKFSEWYTGYVHIRLIRYPDNWVRVEGTRVWGEPLTIDAYLKKYSIGSLYLMKMKIYKSVSTEEEDEERINKTFEKNPFRGRPKARYKPPRKRGGAIGDIDEYMWSYALLHLIDGQVQPPCQQRLRTIEGKDKPPKLKSAYLCMISELTKPMPLEKFKRSAAEHLLRFNYMSENEEFDFKGFYKHIEKDMKETDFEFYKNF